MSLDKDLVAKIKPYLDKGNEPAALSKLYCYDSCFAFNDSPDEAFALFQEVSEHFALPIRSIYSVGSAQLGYSFFKNKPYNPKSSDLDLAIVSTDLFLEYYELCYKVTNKYKDLSVFPNGYLGMDSNTISNMFKSYLASGYFRPDLMPKCEKRTEWLKFFEKLGDKHIHRFKKISCGIYINDSFFLSKQDEVLQKMKGK